MYFQLMAGVHIDEHKNVYEVRRKNLGKDEDTGEDIVQIINPIIETDRNLTRLFGAKFRKIVSETEAKALLQEMGGASGVLQSMASGTPDADKPKTVSEAVQEGAKDITRPKGRNLTKKFPDAEEVGLEVIFQPGGKYLMVESKTGHVLTEKPLKKEEVQPFIEDYMER